MISLNQIELIRERYRNGESMNSIAREMKIDWKTVDKYVKKDDFNDTVEDYAKKVRPSKLDPYKAEIDALLEQEAKSNYFHKQHLTGKRVYDILYLERGHEELKTSYQIIRLYVKEVRRRMKRDYGAPRTSHLVWNPGETQADFGEADFIVDGGKTRLKYFVLTFPYSNRKLMVVMPGENCECVCLALQTIFTFIGGVPKRIVFDNATGIGRRIRDTIEVNAGFTRFRLHYGFSTSFTNPRAGWEKGSVENAVGTLRRNLFVPVPMISGDLMEYNINTLLPKSFAFREDEEHYRKGETVADLFEADREALLTMNPKPFVPNRIESVKADGYGDVVVDINHRYGLGPEHVHEEILVEKTAFKLVFSTKEGKLIREFKREYSSTPTETYDMETLLQTAAKKPGSWLNSMARSKMEEGVLKKWLDSIEDKQDKGAAIYRLFSATMEFGFADACTAMESLLNKGKAPSKDDIYAVCRRLQQDAEMSALSYGDVDLRQYDTILKMGDGKEVENAQTQQ